MKPLSYKLYFQEDDDDFDFNDKYWDSGLGAAGCIFISKDTGRILLAHRSNRVDFEPHTWGTWGGKIDDGETPMDAVVREVEEETGYNGKYKINPLWTFEDPEVGFKYYNYLVLVPFEFTPKLNWENDDSKWVEWGEWPSPIHFGLAALVKNSAPILTKIIKLIKRKKADILEVMNELPPSPPAIVQPAVTNANIPINITNAYIVVTTLWGEARGEGAEGMQAVMNVIMNRAKGKFDKTADVVLKPMQFSMWNNVTNPVQTTLDVAARYRNDAAWKEAVRIVGLASNGKLPDITGGALFYFNPKKANPTWKNKLIKTVTIGNHDFYKLPKPKKHPVKKKVPTTITEMIQKQNPRDTVVFKKGIVGDGVFEYEMRSPFSFIRYKFAPKQKLFYLDMIGTPRAEDQGQGHATAIMETFFQMVKQYGGTLDCDTYTTSGMEKIKPSVEKMSKQYGVRLVKEKDAENIDNYKTSDTLSESYGGPGDHVVFGGIWYPERIVANIVTQKNGASPGHTMGMGRMRWTYYQGVKTVFWNSTPDDEQKDAVQRWLNHKGYDVNGHRLMKDMWTFMHSFYKKRNKDEPIAEGERTDYLDQEISKLETEWDRLDSMGQISHQQEIQKQLEKLYREREHWRKIYGAVDRAHNQGFALVTKPNDGIIRENTLLMENFERWFGKSKVVDKNGKPLVVWKSMKWWDKEGKAITHVQSPLDFAAGHRDEPPARIGGGFFTDDHEVAKGFRLLQVSKQDEPRAFYLRIENPFVIDLKGQAAGRAQFFDAGKVFRDALQNNEYDGIILLNTKDEGNVFVTKDPWQCKLLDSGFDPEAREFAKESIVKETDVNESLKDWNGIWVHYSQVNYLKLQDYDKSQSSIEGDPNAIYLFPERFAEKMRHHYFKSMKFISYIEIPAAIKVLDLSEITSDTLQEFEMNEEELKQMKHEKLGGELVSAPLRSMTLSEAFWTVLRRRFRGDGKKFRKYLMRKGYDAFFDDTDAIHRSEVQLGILDPSKIKVLKTIPVSKTFDVYKKSDTITENTLLMENRATPKQLVEFLRAQIKGTEWDGKVFAVGGFVRDLLLGKEPKDLDIVIGIDQGGTKFTKWLGQKLGIYREGSNPVIYPTFGTANLRLEGVIWNGIDFSTENIDAVMFRKEQYHDPNSRKPVVQFTPDIAVDAQRRDITFNALYLDIASGEILDPTGRGKEDLKTGIVRTAIDPTVIYTDDALRMFRAVRFAAQFNFKLSPEVMEGIKNNLHRLHNTSKERVRDELNKILVSKHPDYGLRLLRDTGLLSHIGAEFQQAVGMTQNQHHSEDVFDHTISVIMGTNPELLRRLIALFHDIGKVTTRSVTPSGVHFYGHEEMGTDIVEKIMMDLKYPRTLIDAVKLGVRHHMRLKQGGDDGVKLSDSTLRRFKIAMGEYLEHVLDVIHADNTAHASASAMPNQIAAVRQRLANLDIKVSKPNLPINGNDLLALGFTPGPSIGNVLKAVTDKWYENPQISKEEALAIARSML